MPKYEIVWVNAAEKAAGMGDLASRVGSEFSSLWAESVAEIGEKAIAEMIDAGGKYPTQKGGPRIDTGVMKDSVFSNGGGGSAGYATARAGWVNNLPYYVKFQERGTKGNFRGTGKEPKKKPLRKTGIPPMLAIPFAQEMMAASLKPTGRTILSSIRTEWNKI